MSHDQHPNHHRDLDSDLDPGTSNPASNPGSEAGDEAGGEDLWDDTALDEHHVDVDPITGEIGVTDTSAAASPATSTDTGGDELYFGSVDEFVRELVVPTFLRRTGDRASSKRWAADWWRYPEAVMRLEAMWRAWEHLRLEPNTGLSVWLREHADPQLAVLFSHDGPFAKSTDSSDVTEPLPYTAPPEGLFPDVRTTR